MDSVCVKCAGKHKTIDCQLTKQDNNPKCALCGGNHTANYKGCEVYKTLKIQRFPPPRQRENTNEDIQAEVPSSGNERYATLKTATSYADAVAQNLPPKQNSQSQLPSITKQNKQTPPQKPVGPLLPPQTQNIDTEQTSDIRELKEMMKQLILQMTNMLNILTLLINKHDDCRS